MTQHFHFIFGNEIAVKLQITQSGKCYHKLLINGFYWCVPLIYLIIFMVLKAIQLQPLSFLGLRLILCGRTAAVGPIVKERTHGKTGICLKFECFHYHQHCQFSCYFRLIWWLILPSSLQTLKMESCDCSRNLRKWWCLNSVSSRSFSIFKK